MSSSMFIRARWVSSNLVPLLVHVFQQVHGRLLNQLGISAFLVEILQEVHRGLLEQLELGLFLVEILQDVQGRPLGLFERPQTLAQSSLDSESADAVLRHASRSPVRLVS